MAVVSIKLLLSHRQLHTPDAKPIAGAQHRFSHALVVDERPVGARQIDHLERIVRSGQPAMNARHERGIQNEIGPRGTADSLDGARLQSKRHRIVGRLGSLQGPHGAISY